jgi:hypothetical protein
MDTLDSAPGAQADRPRMNADQHQAWADALDALDLEVAATEALLANLQQARELPASAPWSPPPGLGPLPPDLQPRADRVLTRQLALAVPLAGALASTRQQSAVARRLQTGRGPSRPAYLDRAV